MAAPPYDRPRLKEVFADARALPASERQAYVAAACAGNEALRQEVESLLAFDERAKSFLELPAVVRDGGSPHPAQSTIAGRRLGAYQVQALIGAGGMGEVYRARDTKLQRDVAVKFLPRAFARDPERLSRFEREARMLAALNHPNIGAIYGFEEADDLRFLVLELVNGRTVADTLADASRQRSQGPGLPVRDALSIARQIASALDVAHKTGIVHRDLKPANIVITPDGMVKVLDFGLAKAVGDAWAPDAGPSHTDTVNRTEDSAVMGTPRYMSPEQARGQGVDKRSDIWAFGCVLYELLTGRVAFQGRTASEAVVAVLDSEPRWDVLPRETPVSVRLMLRRCLDKNPAERLQDIAQVRRTLEQAPPGSDRWQVAAVAAAALGTLAIGGVVWLRDASRASQASEWVQITKFPDSVSQPALSPDGRMVTFIRGPRTFWGPGQVYVKALPDGEPVQLTRDSSDKMSPVFSPDGSRIAYTTVSPQFGWDTWTVPVMGGEPQRWLRNASGLVWAGPRDVLFAEMKQGTHMGIVASDDRGIRQHAVYLPAHDRAMAHRAYASPDGKWVLLAEMNQDYVWIPCRLVPADGSSPGRQVGPRAAGCTFGAWSPDGKWIYLTSDAGGGGPHIWRQRFPDGQPEQVTFGPTAQEGIAVAPDGRSLVTAVALENVTIWLHDASGERQISSLEGTAISPQFTRDGQRLCYLIGKESPTPWVMQPAEMWVADLKSGRSESLAPELLALSYDISADSEEVVMEVADDEGKPRLWLVPFDRRAPPRQIPNVEGRQPKFGPDGDIFFRTAGTVYRAHSDGTAIRKALEPQIHLLKAVSPDGRWLIGSAPLPGNESSVLQAFPLDGGSAIRIGAVRLEWNWSPGGDSLSISARTGGANRSYLIPLAPGETLPRVPVGGFRSEEELAALPGARAVDVPMAVPGSSPEVYAFYRGTTQRNLFRIPLH